MTLIGYKIREGDALYYVCPTIEDPRYFSIIGDENQTVKTIIGRQAIFIMRFRFLDYSIYNSKERFCILDIESGRMYFISNKEMLKFIKKLSNNLINIINLEEQVYEAIFKIKKIGKIYGLEFVTQQDMNSIDDNIPEEI